MTTFNAYFNHKFPEMHLPQEPLIALKKKYARYRRMGEQNARPSHCLVCGKECKSLCNSHSIPQFCLKEIAVEGKLHTINRTIRMEPLQEEIGVNSTGTFRLICRECDNHFFAEYENPDRYSSDYKIDDKIMALIAMKINLLELNKARVQIETLEAVYRDLNEGHRLSNMTDARRLDEQDDLLQIDYARSSILDNGHGYRLLFDALLNHVAPIAFQGMVAPTSDFDGRVINDTLNESPDYHIEPLYICIFPLSYGTRVFVFCRDEGYSRYARFHRHLRAQTRHEALQSILQVILAYSEEIYFCPLLPEDVFQDDGFSSLAKQSNLLSAYNTPLTTKARKRAYAELAIQNLPKPPRLFSAQYSMNNLLKSS